MIKSTESGFIHVIAVVILLAGIVGGLYLVSHPQIFQPKASNNETRIEIVDDQGNSISSTTTQNIKVKLTFVPTTSTPTESISASPNPCTLGVGGISGSQSHCLTTISWSAAANTIPGLGVWGRSGTGGASCSGNELGIANPDSGTPYNGSKSNPHITAEGVTFDLCYNGTLLKSITVTGVVSSSNVQGVSTTKLLAQASTADTLPWSDAEIADWIQRNQSGINQVTPPGITRQHPGLLASLGTRAGIVAAVQLYTQSTGGIVPPSLDALYQWATAGYATTTGPGTLPTTLTLSPSGEITSLPDGFIRIAWTDAPSGAQLALRRESGGGWQNAPISVATSSTTAQLAMGDTLGVEIRNASGATLASGSVHLSAPVAFPTHFKIANSQDGLASAREEAFDQNGKIVPWTLTPGPGGKTVYAQFKVNGVWADVVTSSIGLVFPNQASSTPESSSSATLFVKADKKEVGVDQTVKVDLYALTNEAANLFNAKINFPKDLLEVTSIEESSSSEIKSIVEKTIDNTTGTISIVAGVPNPGIKTSGDTGILIATIVMKTKASGSAKITFDASSQILKNDDNSNIISQRDGITISIDQNFISRIISGIGSNTSQSGSTGTNQGAISSGTVAAGSGDGNGDGKVDLIDLSILMSDFNKTSGIRSGIDMNQDGTINSFDSSILTNILVQKGVLENN